MNATKEGNILTLTLNEEESEALDYLIERRGMRGMVNGLQAWLDTRKNTVEAATKKEIFGIYKNMNPTERQEFRSKKRGRLE